MAKAFIAVQRGQDPYSALTPEEKEELRGASRRTASRTSAAHGDLKERPELIALGGLVAGLAGVGLGQLWLTVLGGALALAGMLLRGWARFRSNRLKNTLAAALAADERDLVFERLAAVLPARPAARGSGSCAGKRTAWAARSSCRKARLRRSGR